MIVDHITKTIILGNPKTGTTTLKKIFDSDSFFQPMRHVKYDFFCKDPQYTGYKYFGFYREPFDRFLSTVSYMKETYKENFLKDNNKIIWQYNLGMKIMGLKDVDEITPTTILNAIEAGLNGPILDLFAPQIEWLNNEVNLLSFYYFDDGVRCLANQLNVAIPEKIPNLNKSNKKYLLTVKEETRVKNFYKKDYEFLESKGVI